MKKPWLVLIAIVLLLAGCGPGAVVPVSAPLVVDATSSAIPPVETPIPDPTLAPAPTSTPSPPAGPDRDGLSQDAFVTLDSLVQVGEYPLYAMHYHADYSQRLPRLEAAGQIALAGARAPAWACSLFAALGDADGHLYGRNFDWRFSPALLLFTNPPDGYASVSMVDIAYLVDGDKVHTLSELPVEERQGLLDAPYWPFDGMNEHGLAIGMAAVPPGRMLPDPAKETIGSLSVMRLILDHARDVDEAVSILKGYNVDMAGGPDLHYLVADRSGRAVLVEFYQGEVVVLPNESPWHQATNFLCSAVESASGNCWRYDRIQQILSEAEGQLVPRTAMDLLSQVAQENTQWSVVYGMNTGDVEVVMDRQYGDVHAFHLPIQGED